MSQPEELSAEQARPAPTLSMQNTPNAEKYVLEADEMRRRQLRTALLHGTRETWREYKRIWPAVVVGLIVVAVILAGMAVLDAFRVTKKNDEERDRQMQKPPATAPANPGEQRDGPKEQEPDQSGPERTEPPEDGGPAEGEREPRQPGGEPQSEEQTDRSVLFPERSDRGELGRAAS